MTPAEYRAYQKRYYAEHREHINAMKRIWTKDNRERINANQRYRYRKDAEYRARMIEANSIYRKKKRSVSPRDTD